MPEEKQVVHPAIISPVKMLEGRLPAMALDPRHASDCMDVRPENGVVKKRKGYAAFSVDINGGSTFSGRIKGLCQTPFGWTDDIVALLQDATNTSFYIYSTAGDDWLLGEQTANTAYGQLSWCPAVTSGGVEVVVLSDDKIPIQVWDDSQATAALKVAPISFDSGSTLKAKIVRYFYDRLCVFNVDVDASRDKKMVKWTGVGDITDDDGGSSASNLILGRRGGHIVGADHLADDMTIYCEHEIIRMAHIGGTSIFRFDPMVSTKGLAAQNAICNLGDRHLFLADNFTVQEYCGGQYCTSIGDPINASIQSVINKDYATNSFFVNAIGLSEAWLFIPTTTATPDAVYVIKYGGCVEDYQWFKYSMTAFAAMAYDNWYVLSGGTDIINNYDYSATNDGSTAIDGKWNSIDFTNVKNPAQMIRHEGIRFEAKGDAVSLYYSVDEGTVWTTIGSQNLTSGWAYYKLPFDSGYKRKVRYRFRNDSTSQTFELKWFQPVLLPSEEK